MPLVLPPASSSRPAIPAVVAAIVLAVLALATCARGATLTVTPTTVSGSVPAGFVGLSTEVHSLENYTGTNPRTIDPAFLNLLGDIAPGQSPVLRIGGDSTDWSWYPIPHTARPRGVSYTISPNWLNVARATAQATHGRLILGVNLEANSQPVAIGEADAMVKRIGTRYIDAIEIGNEPELYAHFAWYRTASGVRVPGRAKSTWTQAAYHRQFAAIAHAMPKVTIAGPTSGEGVWLNNLGGFLRAEPSVGLTTMHAYPLKHCTPSHVITIPELLANSASDGFVSQVTPFVAAAHRAGKPMRIDEVNAISCGGTAKVSDSFASALWMLNTLFGLARTGADGINVHTVPGSINAILNPTGASGRSSMQVQPEYYAMMMFARAAPPGSRLLRLSGALPAGIEAWAARDVSGTVRVVLINKRSSGPATVSLNAPAASGPASLERLRAAGLAATGGVTLGGQSFGSATASGLLSGTPDRSAVVPLNGSYTVDVPGASAAMLTLTPPPAQLLLTALAGPELLESLLPSW